MKSIRSFFTGGNGGSSSFMTSSSTDNRDKNIISNISAPTLRDSSIKNGGDNRSVTPPPPPISTLHESSRILQAFESMAQENNRLRLRVNMMQQDLLKLNASQSERDEKVNAGMNAFRQDIDRLLDALHADWYGVDGEWRARSELEFRNGQREFEDQLKNSIRKLMRYLRLLDRPSPDSSLRPHTPDSALQMDVKIPKRILNRPAPIRIPIVKVHDARTQEIEYMKQPMLVNRGRN